MPINIAGAGWFHHQFEEERAQPNSENRIPGYSDWIPENDDLIVKAEGQVAQAEGKTPLQRITGLGARDSPDSRPNNFSPASNTPSTSILPEYQEAEDPRTERAEILWCQDHPNRGGQVRTALPYMFPPFVLINWCLDKIREEGVDALIVYQ